MGSPQSSTFCCAQIAPGLIARRPKEGQNFQEVVDTGRSIAVYVGGAVAFACRKSTCAIVKLSARIVVEGIGVFATTTIGHITSSVILIGARIVVTSPTVHTPWHITGVEKAHLIQVCACEPILAARLKRPYIIYGVKKRCPQVDVPLGSRRVGWEIHPSPQ